MNDTQREFDALCEKGGGPWAGPARRPVRELLRRDGQTPSGSAVARRRELLAALPDAEFEPGALYETNSLLEELCRQLEDRCMIDGHCGVYRLGTHHVHANG